MLLHDFKIKFIMLLKLMVDNTLGMVINYNPLWKVLIDKQMWLPRWAKNQYTSLEGVERIDAALECGINYIIELLKGVNINAFGLYYFINK